MNGVCENTCVWCSHISQCQFSRKMSNKNTWHWPFFSDLTLSCGRWGCNESLQFKCSHSVAAFWSYTFTKSNFTSKIIDTALCQWDQRIAEAEKSNPWGNCYRSHLRTTPGVPNGDLHVDEVLNCKMSTLWPTFGCNAHLNFSSSSSSLHSYAN